MTSIPTSTHVEETGVGTEHVSMSKNPTHSKENLPEHVSGVHHIVNFDSSNEKQTKEGSGLHIKRTIVIALDESGEI